jgi:hypothetical protein
MGLTLLSAPRYLPDAGRASAARYWGGNAPLMARAELRGFLRRRRQAEEAGEVCMAQPTSSVLRGPHLIAITGCCSTTNSTEFSGGGFGEAIPSSKARPHC